MCQEGVNVVIAAVDVIEKDLVTLTDCLKEVFPGQQVEAFADPLMAVKYFYNNRVDALFAAASLPRVSGFELARIMNAGRRGVATCLIGASEGMREDVRKAGVDAYLVKPVTVEKVRACGVSLDEHPFATPLTDEECELAAAGIALPGWDEKPFWKLWWQLNGKDRG